MLMLPYGQFLAHRPQPMHQSSMIDLQRIAPADGADRAADHAQRIAALPAGGRDQIFVEAQAFADQPGDAVVRVGAGADAVIAAGAVLQIEHQQALRFHQALREKGIERHAGGGRQALAVLFLRARAATASRLCADVGERVDHAVEIVAWMRTTST